MVGGRRSANLNCTGTPVVGFASYSSRYRGLNQLCIRHLRKGSVPTTPRNTVCICHTQAKTPRYHQAKDHGFHLSCTLVDHWRACNVKSPCLWLSCPRSREGHALEVGLLRLSILVVPTRCLLPFCSNRYPNANSKPLGHSPLACA